jgi:WD40 repeat protein
VGLTGLGPTFAFNDRGFSADGKTLAVVHDDRTVKLYETRYGQVRASFMAHGDKVSAVCFSADGKVMATGGADGTVKLWFARFE